MPFTSAQLTHQRLCYQVVKRALLRGQTALAWQSLQVLLFCYSPALESSAFLEMLLRCCRTDSQEDLVLEAFRQKNKSEKQVLLHIGRLAQKGRWKAAEELVE